MFLLTWLHGVMAIIGMRRLGEVLSTGRWQSYVMAFSYLLSGPVIAHWVSGQIPYCWGLCYVPWLLYHAVRTEEPWQGRRLAVYSGCLALQFLCGHPQVFWFSAIGQATFIIASTARLPLRQALRELGPRFGQFGVACAWCAGLVATALLPMLELAHESNRAENTAAFANSFNMRWSDLRYLAVPRWDGLLWENNLLVGVVVVSIGIMGLCRVRERNVRGLLGMLVIGFLLALGDNTPFFGVFYKWLPGYAGFRFQPRAALLAVLALICAEGIWLSRPHPRLRGVWSYLSGIPIAYGLTLLVGLQAFEALQGAWITKRFVPPTSWVVLDVPLEHSLERALLRVLRERSLLQPSQPPPRVCVPPSAVPANSGMLYHYSSFDASCSLFLRRPWDYLHEMLGVTPLMGKGCLSPEVYDHGPFPYDDLSLTVGKPPKSPRLEVNQTPTPRALVVYAAERADYGVVLNRLTNRHDIAQRALLETPLTEPLPHTNQLVATPAVVRRFEPNEMLIDVDAKTNGLLVVGEAWYPGWRAEVDKRAGICVPANIWMRGIPVPAGRHNVRLYFQQDYLVAGGLISFASLGLLVSAVAWRARGKPASLGEPEVVPVAPRPSDPHPLPATPSGMLPAQPRAGGRRPARRQPRTQRPARAAPGQVGSSGYRPLLRFLAFGAVLAFAGLLVYAEIREVRWFAGKTAGADAYVELKIGDSLGKQEGLDVAKPHFFEALRLGEYACRLTEYKDPMQYWVLTVAYYGTGSFDKALEMGSRGLDLALATGQSSLADILKKQMNAIAASKARAEERK
jgi:hypothetical protein